jgi:hypothetical protein
MGYCCGAGRESFTGNYRMTLFITSYQKSGTHQIMPMFVINPDVVDRSWVDWIDVPDKYGLNKEINQEGVQETAQNLRQFKGLSPKAFGHVAYRPEYAQVLEETDTKVLFNIRDPRDIIVSEYENAQRKFALGDDMPMWNYYDQEAEEFIFRKPDPISDLIVLAAARWPQWLGWLDHDFVKPVKYENLRLHTRETVEELIEWLDGFGCTTVDSMVKKALPKKENPTFRKGSPGEWKEKFRPHHVVMADDLLSDIIKTLGYE